MAVWAEHQAFELASAPHGLLVLDQVTYPSIKAAVGSLNSGAAQCSQGFCVYQAPKDARHLLLYRSDRENEAINVISDALQAGGHFGDGVSARPEELDTDHVWQSIVAANDGDEQPLGTLHVEWRGSILKLVLPPEKVREAVLDMIPSISRTPQHSRDVAAHKGSSAARQSKDVGEQMFVKGEQVQIFSNSEKKWFDGTIDQAFRTDGVFNGHAIKAGTLLVAYAGRSKYILPDDVGKQVRKVALETEETSPVIGGQADAAPDGVKSVHATGSPTEAGDSSQAEKISPDPVERVSPTVIQALKAGAGCPIDPGAHDVPDMKTSAMIDNNRVKPRKDQAFLKFNHQGVTNAVLYEAAAVSAKLRNTILVGGERPSDVEIFVEVVETPYINAVALPKREGTIGGRPGEDVSDLTPMVLWQAVEKSSSFQILWRGTVLDMLIEESLVDGVAPVTPGSPVRIVSPLVAAYAAVLFNHLRFCCKEVLNDEPLPRFICMPTICADMAVAMKDKAGQVVVNVIAFQQADCCEVDAVRWMFLGDEGHWRLFSEEESGAIEAAYSDKQPTHSLQRGQHSYIIDFGQWVSKNVASQKQNTLQRVERVPSRIRPEEWKRQLTYWTQRIAMAQAKSGPTGLYDPVVRQRFKDALSVGQPPHQSVRRTNEAAA